MEKQNENIKKVQKAIEEFGFNFQIKEFSNSTKTSAEASKAIGCGVEQIAKSLVFKTKNTNKPILVIASGINRVNEEKIKQLINEEIEKASADFVKKTTGFVIGGIPPIGHKQPLLTFIDQDLLTYQEIWAAAGNPHAVFKLTSEELIKITNGKIVDIK